MKPPTPSDFSTVDFDRQVAEFLRQITTDLQDYPRHPALASTVERIARVLGRLRAQGFPVSEQLAARITHAPPTTFEEFEQLGAMGLLCVAASEDPVIRRCIVQVFIDAESAADHIPPPATHRTTSGATPTSRLPN